MGPYARYVFPFIVEATMRLVDGLRASALADARGAVLEVGFGTGRNLPHYPAGVERLVAIDPMTAFPRLLARRVAAAAFRVERVAIPADGSLPFGEDEFDTVVLTWTLCTIPDPVAALREMRRVLRRDGVLLFIEHGLSQDPRVGRWQTRLTPIQRVVGCGCHLDRPIDRLIESAGFRIDRLDRFVLDGSSQVLGSHYRGSASQAPLPPAP